MLALLSSPDQRLNSPSSSKPSSATVSLPEAEACSGRSSGPTLKRITSPVGGADLGFAATVLGAPLSWLRPRCGTPPPAPAHLPVEVLFPTAPGPFRRQPQPRSSGGAVHWRSRRSLHRFAHSTRIARPPGRSTGPSATFNIVVISFRRVVGIALFLGASLRPARSATPADRRPRPERAEQCHR